MPLNVDQLVMKLTKLGETYAEAGILWKSDLHPRDHYGKFAKKGQGVFTLLNDLDQGNYHGVSFQGSAGYLHHADIHPTTKVGGVVITPPEGKGYAYSEHHIDWALKPGEKAYKAHGGPTPEKGQTGVIIHHTNGSATVLMPTPEGEMPKVGLQSHYFSDMLAKLQAAGYTVDTDHPLDENLHEEAAKYDQTVAELEHAKEIGAVTPQLDNTKEAAKSIEKAAKDAEKASGNAESESGGKHFQDVLDEEGKKLGHIEKTPNGKYTSHDANGNKIGNITKHLPTAIEKVKSGKLTTPDTYEHKKPAKEAEKAAKAEENKNAHLQDIHNEAGKKIGHIEKTPEGKYVSHDQNGEKIGNTAKHLDTAVAKVHAKHEQDETVASALGKKEEPKKEAAPENPTVKTSEDVKVGGEKVGYVNSMSDGTFEAHDKQGKLLGSFSHFFKANAAIYKAANTEINKAHNDQKAKEEFGKHYQVSGGQGTVAEHLESGFWHAFDENGNELPEIHPYASEAMVAVKKNFAEKQAGNKQDILDDFGSKIGHIEKTPEGKWASFDADGNKLGYTISNVNMATAKVHNAAASKLEKDMASKPAEEPLPEWEKELLGEFDEPKTPTYTYSGKEIELKPGDQVWADNATPEHGIWVNHSDGTATGYYPEHGNIGDFVKSFESGEQSVGPNAPHVPVGEWTLQKSVPGTPEPSADTPTKTHVTPEGLNIPLSPGDVLYKDGSYAVFNSYGTLKDVYVPSSGNHYNVHTDDPQHWNTIKKGWEEEYPKKPQNVVETYNGPSVVSQTMKEAPVPTPKAAAKAPKKSKKIKDSELPDTIEIQNGNKLHAEPGSSLWTNDAGLHMKLVDGKSEVYGEDGKLASWLGGSKMSEAAAKKKGWTKVGQGAPKEDLGTLLPTASPTKNFETAYNATYYAKYETDNVFAYGSHYNVDPFSTDTQNQIAEAIANIKQAREKFGDDLTKSQKIQFTKAENHLTNMLSLSVLGSRMSDPNYEVTASDDANFNALKAKVTDHYNSYKLVGKIDKLIADKAFEKGQKDLGFDLSSGSDEEFMNYALAQGANNVGGMTPDQIKQWTFSHLNHPDYKNVDKAGIEKTAGQVLQKKAVAALAEQANAKKLAMQPSKEEQLAAKATVKQQEHEYDIAAKMHSTYETPSGDILDYSLENGYFSLLPAGEVSASTFQKLTPSQAKEYLAEHPEFTATSWAPLNSDGIGKRAVYLKDIVGISGTDHSLANYTDAIVNDHLIVPGTGAMSDTQKKAWLMAYLRGDSIEKYQIQKNVLGENDGSLTKHAGNPNTDSGKASRQALADFLSTQDWWTNKTDNQKASVFDWSSEDLQSAVDSLHLTDARDAMGLDPKLWDNPTLMLDWILHHKDAITLPPSSHIASGPQTVVVDGKTWTVPENYLVAEEPSVHGLIFLNPETGDASMHIPGTPSWETEVGDGSHLHYDDPKAKFADILSSGTWQNITPQWGGTSAPSFKGLTPKPYNVDQQAWDITAGIEEGGPAVKSFLGSWANASDDSVTQMIHSSGAFDPATELKLMAAPDNVKKLAAWAADTYGNTWGQESTDAKNVLNALKARADANEYVPEDTFMFKHEPSGKSIPVPPGSEIFQNDISSDNYAVVFPNSAGGMKITASGTVTSFSNSYAKKIANQYHSIQKLPEDTSFKKASQEGQTFTESALNKVNEAEAQSVWNSYHTNEATAAYDFKSAIKNLPEGNEKYGSITDKLFNYPVGVKQLAVDAAQHGNTDTLDAIMWKTAKGSYVAKPTTVEHPLVPEGKTYSALVAKGQVDEDTIEGYWPSKAVNEFIADYNIPDINSYSYESEKAHAIAQKLAQLKAEQPTSVQIDPMRDYANLAYAPIDKSYDGMHTKQGYTDQYGREWMSKFYSNDPNAQYRLEAEHYANVIGKTFGFNSAQSFVGNVGGHNTITQLIADTNGNMSGYGPHDLNEAQLGSAMQEHVLDWLISNHDSHYGNLLRLPDGQNIMGIDKGQAFKFVHSDRLEPGYKPEGNFDPVWYDQFYHALANGDINEELANKIAERVLTKAYQVQTRADGLFQKHVESALANRDFWPSEYPTREAFIQALMDRKHALVSDFEKMYRGLFKKAGYDWKINTEDFGKKVGEASVQNNAVFAKELKDAKGYGKALFFNSPDLEDHHIMMTHMNQKGGGDGLLMSAKITEGADSRLTDYIKSLFNGNLAYGGQANGSPKPSNSALPHTNDFYSALVSYAKTVNQHALTGGKEPNGEFNATTVQAAHDAAAKAKSLMAEIDFARKEDPSKIVEKSANFPHTLVTLEQQDALFNALEHQVSQYETINAAHQANVALKAHSPDFGMIEPVSYEPTKGLSANAESEPAALYKLPNGEYAWKTTDGGHYFSSDSLGSDKTYASATDFANAISNKDAEWVPAIKEDAPYWKSTDGTTFTQNIDGSWVETASPHTKPGEQVAPYILSHQELVNYLDTQPTSEWQFHTNETEKSIVVPTQAKQLVVSHRPARGHTGSFDPKTGNMVQISDKPVESVFHPGYEYTVEHDNVKIHYRPWTEPGVARTQQGLLSVEVKDWNGQHDQIANVLDTLDLMGVTVTPADAESLKLGYYRQMTNIIKDRNDYGSGKSAATLGEIKSKLAAEPHMSEPEQLQMYQDAWQKHYGVDPETVGFVPQFHENNGVETSSGRPYWLRPDTTLEQLKGIWNNNTLLQHTMMISGYNSDNETEAMNRTFSILASGKLLSTEERARVLNQAVGGLSSSEDQVEYGSSAFVYTRQNNDVHSLHPSSAAPIFLLRPEAALQHTSYAFGYDAWGNVSKRTESGNSGSPYTPEKMYGSSYVGTAGGELMVKNEAPVAIAILNNANQRDEIMARLRAEGYNTINGHALEEVIYTQEQWEKEYEKRIEEIWKESIARQKKYTGGANE